MINIVFEDQHLLVVNKPHDLLSVPGRQQQPNLFDILRRTYANVRLVHRLDMATSGLMVLALSHSVQAALSRQFEQREVKKTYAALVSGRVDAHWGEISLPLSCDWPNRPRQKLDWLSGRSAHTAFEVLSRRADQTLLRLYPTTGRSHQLRVHCMALGHPILGDRFYNPAPSPERMMLHAERLAFHHPIGGSPLELLCPAPFGDRSP